MKNKKKLILIGVIAVIVIVASTVTLSLTLFKSSNNEVYKSKDIQKRPVNNGFLTLMIETGANTGKYQESTSGNWPGDDYEFNSELSACEKGGELLWDNELNIVKLITDSSDKCYVYFDKKPITLASVCTNGEILSDCLIKYYNEAGDMNDGLYYHDADLENGAADNSYRYTGANPNNYVCFGEDCNNTENLYRIIGLFNSNENYQAKLIKYDYTTNLQTGTDGAYVNNYTSGNWETNYYKGTLSSDETLVYNWNVSGNQNTWSISNLNSTNLNDNFLNSLEYKFKNMIVNSVWYVNGFNSNKATAKTWYYAESTGAIYNAKIGLMYVSDYGFAASPDYWSINIDQYNNSTIITNNWMHMGLYEWTLSRDSSTSNNVFNLNVNGTIDSVTIGTYVGALRPTFYLNSEVLYVGGDGSKENPIKLDYEPSTSTLVDYILNQYTEDGINGLYYHDEQGNYTNSNLEAGDNSYRYAGAQPNNYVCFGSDATTCPSDNLYRIIGLFDEDSDGIYQVKLIKSTYASSDLLGTNGDYNSNNRYHYNELYKDSSGGDWGKSALNTVNLNTNFYNSFDKKYQDKIYENTWYIGGFGATYATPKIAFNYEITSTNTYKGKIGLMYTNEYGYASLPEAWSTYLWVYDKTNLNNNWIYSGIFEWTMSNINSGYPGQGNIINDSGSVSASVAVNIWEYVRPVFYLAADVEYFSGSGTQSNPYRIVV